MQDQHVDWGLALIQKYNYSGPRYTSYPTALEFNEQYDDAAFRQARVCKEFCVNGSIA